MVVRLLRACRDAFRSPGKAFYNRKHHPNRSTTPVDHPQTVRTPIVVIRVFRGSLLTVVHSGFAVRCAAAALPRRKLGTWCRAAPWPGAEWFLNKTVRGVVLIQILQPRGGAKPPPHIRRQSRNSLKHLLLRQ